ncbi:MAG: 2-oxo acid dehydrogenase subunit E2 [Oligoflexia bacterium]|nr:2-oxo acid dehydrogenase subunit E2 [Oligoflexia bacterium]
MSEFKLPDLGEGIHEADLVKWHTKVGDEIKEDAPLVDVETDKALVTIPSPFAGRVNKLLGEVGDKIKVGDLLVIIESGGSEQKSATVASPVTTVATLATPATRKMARELGIDINLVKGSGPAGRVTNDDLLLYQQLPKTADEPKKIHPASPIPSPIPSPSPIPTSTPFSIPFFAIDALPDFTSFGHIERVPLRSIRRTIAKKMVQSNLIAPQVAHMDDADITALNALRSSQEKKSVSVLSFIIKASLVALKKFPSFNASIDAKSEELILKKYYNIGIAVNTERGLIVPVLKGADHLSLLQISKGIAELAAHARAADLNLATLQGSSFTITNIGAIGGSYAVPLLNYPDVAILALGKAQEKVVVREGAMVIRTILPLTLTFDHRVVDGADAAHFMSEVVKLLSDPHKLFWEM